MWLNFYTLIKNWLQREEGQDIVEYAVLVIFVGLLILVGIGLFGDQLNQAFRTILERVSAAMSETPAQ